MPATGDKVIKKKKDFVLLKNLWSMEENVGKLHRG